MAPLIVITGPTASGKSSLAMEIARLYDGEIICADSRTVYTGMDIGTAKPTSADRVAIPHHLLDVVEPGEPFSVADFQRRARAAIADIRARNKLPIMVGGTGLYIDSVVLNYTLSTGKNDKVDTERRKYLSGLSVEELQKMINSQRLVMPHNLKNKRHLVSTLMAGPKGTKAQTQPDSDTHVVAITTKKEELEARIRKRADDMFEAGVVDEARHLAARYGWGNEAMSGNIYPILRRLIGGEITRDEAVELFVVSDRQLAKRQLTWLRRHDFVRWYDLLEAGKYLEQLLSSRRRS